MITLTFTEVVFWILTILSLPCSVLLYMAIIRIDSTASKAKAHANRLQDYTEEIAQGQQNLTEDLNMLRSDFQILKKKMQGL